MRESPHRVCPRLDQRRRRTLLALDTVLTATGEPRRGFLFHLIATLTRW